VFEDFGMYLNTALEIVEEITSRVSTFTQDLEYARCYGQLSYQSSCPFSVTTTSTGGGYYDYAEDANDEYDDHEDNAGIESVQQMLHYFDERNQELYKQQEEQPAQEEETPCFNFKLDTSGNGVYYEDDVIIEGQEDHAGVVKVHTQVEETVTVNSTTEEINKQEKQKKSRWLSWF
jgi:hypothetical protein